MQCRELREIACSFLDDELLVETNHAVISHLETCAGCRREVVARRELRVKLRAAIKNAPEMQMRPQFIARLRAGR
ncbi:MAG: zf-HC2 domain-containing protein [Acidobacteriota bacterium]|nr:zf-HC2 domain-containing protein [Acidobacteriota bacterium]